MPVYVNIKRPVFKGFNTIWSLLTEESRPKEDYDAFVLRMLDKKKKRIEEELDIQLINEIIL